MSFISEVIRILSRKPSANVDLDRIHSIETNLISGDYDQALQEIEKMTNNLPPEDEFSRKYLTILKARFLAEKNELEESQTLLDETHVHPVLNINHDIEKSNVLRIQGNLSESLEFSNPIIEKIMELKWPYPEHYKVNSAKLNVLRGKLFNKSGKFDQAVELLNESMEIYRELGYNELLAEPLNDIGISYANRSDATNAMKSWQESLEIYNSAGNERQALKLYNNLGLYNNILGNSEEALRNLEKALELSEKYELTRNTGSITQNIGLILQDQGEIDKSMENFEKARAAFEEIDNKHGLALVKINIGNIYQFIGDFDQSIKIYKESQKILEELDIKNELGLVYNSMASSYHLKGLGSKGLSLAKQSAEIFEEIGNYNQLMYPLFSVVEIAVGMGKMDVAEEFLEKFENNLENIEAQLGQQLYKLAKALILLESDRVVKRAEAQTLLGDIADDEIHSITYTIKAYQELAELLLQELKISASEEALNEFKDLISRLDKITKGEGVGSDIAPTMVEVLILRSKLALIDLDVEEAQNLLNEAEDVAKNNGLKQMIKVVKAEKDIIKDQMMNYKKMVDNNASLYERLQESQIENYLKRAENILKK